MGKPIRNKQLMDFFLNQYHIFLSLLKGQMNYVHCRQIEYQQSNLQNVCYSLQTLATPSQALINLVKKCLGLLQSTQNSLFLHSILQSLGYFTLISCHSGLQLLQSSQHYRLQTFNNLLTYFQSPQELLGHFYAPKEIENKPAQGLMR